MSKDFREKMHIRPFCHNTLTLGTINDDNKGHIMGSLN